MAELKTVAQAGGALHAEQLAGRTQQVFFSAEEEENYLYPQAFSVDFNKRTELDASALDTSAINRKIRELMQQADRSAVTILVAHHPFDEPHAGAAFGRARPGAEAVEQLAADGIDVFLTGHLHVTFAGPTAKRYRIGGRSAIVVEAGTATSTRVRGEPNAFNVLRIDRQAIVVEHLVWNAASGAFARGEVQRFAHTPDGWTPLSLDDQ